MRRRDREITDRTELDRIIRRAQVCRLAMVDGHRPYVVPLCFGYDGHCLFFHTAAAGRKIDILRRNPRVCVEFDVDCRPVSADDPCGWTMGFRSVLGVGRAEFVEDPEGKRRALDLIMRQYAGPDLHPIYREDQVQRILVLRVHLQTLTGKAAGEALREPTSPTPTPPLRETRWRT